MKNQIKLIREQKLTNFFEVQHLLIFYFPKNLDYAQLLLNLKCT